MIHGAFRVGLGPSEYPEIVLGKGKISELEIACLEHECVEMSSFSKDSQPEKISASFFITLRVS